MEGLGVLIVVVGAFVANIPTSCCLRPRREALRFALAARAIQAERFAALKHPRARTNADCDGSLLEGIAAPDHAGRTLLREAADALGLSARGYHRTLRVARTLADLDGEERVARIHIAEALSYRGETLRRAQVAA